MALDHYKYISLATPNLTLYGGLLGKIGKDKEKGDVELLLRRISMDGQNHNFEAVVAHAKDFKPEWEELVLQAKVSAYTPITSTTFAFHSREYEDHKKKLNGYAQNFHHLCDGLSLERDIRIWKRDNGWGQLHSLQGWIHGAVRNALSGYFDLRDNIGKPIGVTGSLSYQ